MSSQDALDMDHTSLLSNATLQALQLHRQPFRTLHADASTDLNDQSDSTPEMDLFSDETTAEQLADIKQALITGDDLLLVLGETGSGKSTLLQQLDDNSGLRIQCFPIQGSERFSTLNLFAGMLEAFKIDPPEKLKDILDELIPCLQQMVAKNTLSTIVLDDAQLVNQTELTQLLSGMLYVNSQDETLMRVALAATHEFEEQIPDLLPEGADMPYASLTIDGFDAQRAAAYLGHRLQNAGFEGEFPFTDRDMASLVEHSGGMPAELHTLTADVLNEKYGRIEDSLPPELMADNSAGFLQSRVGKLVLGALATLLIVFGLLMFIPRSEHDGQGSDSTVAARTDNTPPAEELKLIEQNTPTPAPASNDNAQQALSTGASSDTQGLAVQQSNETLADSTPSAPAVPESQNAAVATVNLEDDSPSQTARTVEADNSAETDSVLTIDSTGSVEENDESEQQLANSEPEPASSTGESDTTVAVAENTQEDNTPQVEPDISPEDAELAQRLESPNWILLQDASQYTIQMSASRERASVENFLRQIPLPPPNSIFSFERDGIVWHALAHGIFSSIEEARLAVERMPEAALRDQPWIRSIRRVQSILQTP